MPSIIEKIYAEALFSLAVEAGNGPDIWEELQQLNALVHEYPQYINLLSAASLKRQEKHHMILQAFEGHLTPLLCDFLCLLSDRSRMRHLPGIVESYRELHMAHHGLVDATVITTFALDDQMRQRIIAKLRAMSGKDVILHEKVDPQIIGGIIVEYEGARIDMSVKQKLESIKDQMRSATL